ncbi:MAG: hypothetical protein ACE5H1_02600, partial [Thermodesulfobacteriota bacterium]
MCAFNQNRDKQAIDIGRFLDTEKSLEVIIRNVQEGWGNRSKDSAYAYIQFSLEEEDAILSFALDTQKYFLDTPTAKSLLDVVIMHMNIPGAYVTYT